MIEFDFPYPSQRMPVLARNVVATSQPLAAEAGLNAMRRGGNAMDLRDHGLGQFLNAHHHCGAAIEQILKIRFATIFGLTACGHFL